CELFEVERPEPPFGVGIAPPGAGAGAGRIDEHPVEALGMALDPLVALGRERPALDVADAGAPEPRRRTLEPRRRDVAGDQMTLVLHAGGERQRLATGAGAEIDDAHAGLHGREQGCQLRALVLHLDPAALESLERRQRDALVHTQARGREWRR